MRTMHRTVARLLLCTCCLCLLLVPLGTALARTEAEIGCIPEPIYTEDMPEYYDALFRTCYSQRDYAQAIAACHTALDIDPDYLNAHHNLAIACVAMGRLDEAVTHYTQVIALAPDYAQPYAARADIYQTLRRLDDARQDWDAFVRCYGQHADAYLRRGDFYMSLGEYPAALADFQTAIEKNPRLLRAYTRAAEAAAALDDPALTASLLQQALALQTK